MFKKLLTNLPYNPSLIGQVSFYAKRLHGEERIRKLGLVFVVLAFLVQMFAFVSQPEPTLAESDNDIVRGGFTTRSEAATKCRSNTESFASILAYYGVDCDQVANASTITIRSDAADYDSLGRTEQGPTIYRPLTGKTNQTDEYPVDIAGVGRFWMKNLRAWDSYAYSSYKVLKITKNDGTVIMIMYNCGNIVTEVPYSPPLPPPPPPPTDYCPNISGIQASEAECDLCPALPGIQLSRGDCDVCPNISGVQELPEQCDVCPLVTGIQKTKTECDVCPLVSGTQSNPAECKPCEESENNNDGLACLILSKTARNNTQDIDSADGTTANGGDSITYSLRVKNNGKITVRDYVVEENVSDILDYANITDLNGAKQEGTFIRWPKTDLSPGETISKKFVVKIKTPIPRTPISASDPAHFDLIMNNVYGNQITIKLPPDVIKTTEIVTTSLPNTGPGETMTAVVGFTIFVSYFFARSRLFAKELDIVRTDYATSGGY